MPVWNELGPMWKSFSELDVTSIRDEAMATPRLAMIGSPQKTGVLQGLLHQGPRAGDQLITALATYRLPLTESDIAALADYDLRILLLDDADQAKQEGVRAVLAQPASSVIVVEAAQQQAISIDVLGRDDGAYREVRVVACVLSDPATVHKELFPLLIKQLPNREIALGRAFPALRPAIVHKLVQDVSLTNATYAGGTGLAEMIPGLGIPFAVADVIILTKNQVVMAYKIGLVMGETGTLRETLPKIASVVGAGFMWRQVARELVAFIPLGIVLKVAIAYSGTFVTGQAVYHFYATGEKLKGKDLKLLFNEAMVRGRETANHVVARLRPEKAPALIGAPSKSAKKGLKLPQIGKRKSAAG